MMIDADLMARVSETWAAYFQLSPELFSRPGTTLYPNNRSNTGGVVTLWAVGEHVIAEVTPAAEEPVRQMMKPFPDSYRLTLDDLQRAWGEVEQSSMPLYALDASTFRPYAAPPPYTLRQLTPDDQPAFETFLAQCSDDDRDEGDVSIDHMIAFGLFDGTAIVAASSVFVWRGFIDTGILTIPSHRGKGLGKAAVSACASYYLPRDKVVGYRHDATNPGSQGIAFALGYSLYGVADEVIMPEKLKTVP